MVIYKNLLEIKRQLRAGAYAWPGGYPLYFITQDGTVLSFETVRKIWALIVWDYLQKTNTGWRVIGCDVNWENPDLYCDHSGEKIQSAYCE
jgi:hypothetical protein|tara:strand:- start:42 stop:314 length:273 start_codon:yes stop_codon:yes gene_type:complete